MNEITEALVQNHKAQEIARMQGDKDLLKSLQRIEHELLELEVEGEWPPMASEAVH